MSRRANSKRRASSGTLRVWVALSAGALLASGCGCDDRERMAPVAETTATESNAEETPTPELDPTLGTVRGRIVLAEGAIVPEADNPLLGQPGQPPLPDTCTPPVLADRQTVHRADDGGLSGLVVALHDFSNSPPHEQEVHELEISNCRLSAPIVTATIGDILRITNNTDYPFLPHFGSGAMQALLHGRSRDIVLTQGGSLVLTCGFAAPCGRTEIVTLYHPLHALTDERGAFVIRGVPTGEEVRLGVWHPLFEEAQTAFTLEPGETREIELTVTPHAPTEPTPPVAEGHPEDDPDILF